jgi:hypothetical protein
MKYVVLPTKTIVSSVATKIILSAKINATSDIDGTYIFWTVSKVLERNTDASRYIFHFILSLLLSACTAI